jgi:hypothetical protein
MPAPASADALLTTVALTQSQVPGMADGVQFGFFRIPTISDTGQLAFSGVLVGPGVISGSNDISIWRTKQSDDPVLIAQRGSIAEHPTPGLVYDFLSEPILNDGGQLAIVVTLKDPDGVQPTKNGYLIGGPGGLDWIGGVGDAVPGMPAGNTFNGLYDFRVDSQAGLILYGYYGNGQLVNGRPHRVNAVWKASEQEGSALVVYEGMLAGEEAPGTLHRELNAYTSNVRGQTAVLSELAPPGVDPFLNLDDSIWIGDTENNLALVARTDQPAPGLPEGFAYGVLSEPVLNNQGVIAFEGSLRGPGITASNNRGIWRGTGADDLHLLARSGDQAPGMPEGSFHTSFSNLQLSDTGTIAFTGFVAGPGVVPTENYGVWFGDPDGAGLQLVGRRNGPTPDNAPGLTYRSTSGFALNGAGQLAVLGTLDGPGISPTNDRAIWAQSTSGDFLLIAREGDLMDVNDDPNVEELRTIATLDMFDSSSNSSSQRGPFNSRGELAFRATFTDGSSGLFISRLVAIPEPTSLATILLAAAAMGTHYSLRRKHRR